MKTIKFTKEKNGECILNKEELTKALKEILPGEYVLTIKKRSKPRSLNENSYYHGVIVKMIAEYCGYTPEEAHDALKWEFLRKDGVIPTIRSTTDLSTIEFEEYCSKIRMWASKELGVYIPSPNEPDLDLYMQSL